METPRVSLPYGTQLAGSLSALVNMWWSPAFRIGLIGAAGESVGLTEARILWELGYRGAARPSELAEAMDVAAPNITKAITKLRARDLVEQSTDADDRRVRTVRLTPSGREKADRLYEVGDAMIAQIVEPWSAEQVAQFTAMLQTFVEGAAAFASGMSKADQLHGDGPTRVQGEGA